VVSSTDLYVLIGAISSDGGASTLRELAARLRVDHTLVHRALKRAENAGLYRASTRRVWRNLDLRS
jgi:DNA-binding MarR family transcriptional regulator